MNRTVTPFVAAGPTRSKILILLSILLVLALSILAWRAAESSAYVDPALAAGDSATVSVIVTAGDSAEAARAVTGIGGEVTSDLWLIDAVGATIPTDQLAKLLRQPGIRSVVQNRTVETASNGWVTNRRTQRGSFALADPQRTLTAVLPDGGFVSIDEKGKMLFINADGTERARASLNAGSPFKTPPQVAPDGTVYFSGEEKRVYAYNLNGTERWRFQDAGEKFKSGVVLSSDNQTVYTVEEKRKIIALATADGRRRWHLRPDGDGNVLATPTLGPNGTLYVVTDKGYLYAVSPSGQLLWTFQASGGSPYLTSPLVSADGATIYIAGQEKVVTAVNSSNGSQKYRVTTASKILARPALAADGSLFVATEDRTLHGLDPNGTERFSFRPVTGKFKTSPVLSPDGTTVYVAVEENVLYAVATATGTQRWSYNASGKILSSPLVDADGFVILGSEGRDLVLLDQNGKIVYRNTMTDAIRQTPSFNANGDLAVLVGDKTLVMLGMLPTEWDGRPDALPTENKKVWQLVNPVAIDVGADLVHETRIGDRNVTGRDVTVAVVDSGVYFSREVQQILGQQVTKLFKGQAEFVGPGACTDTVARGSSCFTDYRSSVDGFGHGSHVAGIIWSNFTDYGTGVYMGIAPEANILSIRVLGDNGTGTYEDVIEGIQYVVANKQLFGVRIMNLSLSGAPDVPYFVDPVNRAVEAAWAEGIVVLAAAGNGGPGAQTITVPGNDPYVITVGSVDSRRTPGYWTDDILPLWSSSGPTHDGFVKPDVIAPGANIVSFMYNDASNVNNSSYLVQIHPDYAASANLFRMNGTSMSTAVASGVTALMLQANPGLTPDQVKYRLMYSAEPATDDNGELSYSILRQGSGRIWAPAAVLDNSIPLESANAGMDILADLAHPWHPGDDPDPATNPDLAFHYQGPVETALSDDGLYYLYYVEDPSDGTVVALGVARTSDSTWVTYEEVEQSNPIFSNNGYVNWAPGDAWAGGMRYWAGGMRYWAGGMRYWAGGMRYWAGGMRYWAGGMRYWAGGMRYWAGGMRYWAGGMRYWAGGMRYWAGGMRYWAGGLNANATQLAPTTWIDD